MRPGHVVHRSTADGSSRTDEEELTHADIARERGDDDADEYVEGRPAGARTSVCTRFIMSVFVR